MSEHSTLMIADGVAPQKWYEVRPHAHPQWELSPRVVGVNLYAADVDGPPNLLASLDLTREQALALARGLTEAVAEADRTDASVERYFAERAAEGGGPEGAKA